MNSRYRLEIPKEFSFQWYCEALSFSWWQQLHIYMYTAIANKNIG